MSVSAIMWTLLQVTLVLAAHQLNVCRSEEFAPIHVPLKRAEIDGNSYHFVELEIGTPKEGTKPQRFKMNLDINWHGLFVPARDKMKVPFTKHLHYETGFAKSDSKTVSRTEKRVKQQYYKTTLEAKVFEDWFKLDSPEMSSFRMLFPAVYKASGGRLHGLPYDGAIGLAGRSAHSFGFSDFLPTLRLQSTINDTKYSIRLASSAGTLGELVLNPRYEPSSIEWLFSEPHEPWCLHLNYAQLGQHTIHAHQDPTGLAFLSTASDAIIVPPKVYASIREHSGAFTLEGHNGSFVDCGLKQFSNHSIGFVMYFGPKTSVLKYVQPTSYIKKVAESNHYCRLAIQSSGMKNIWHLGTNFLEGSRFIFEPANRRIGLVLDSSDSSMGARK